MYRLTYTCHGESEMAAPSQAPFFLQEWSTEFELTDETLDALKSKGFNSYKTIICLTSEVIKNNFGKSINMDQFLLLNDAVASLQTNLTSESYTARQ